MTSNAHAHAHLIVGVGTSASGLDALQALLGGLSPGSGIAVVAVSRLDPNAPGLAPELLAAASPLPVTTAIDGAPILADHVYTAPGHLLVGVEEGVFRFVPSEGAADRRTPIDHFLQSLAHHHQNRAVGIILSGAGSDGAQGLKSIGDAGGMTIVQQHGTLVQDGMPRSASDIAPADHVLPPDRMSEELLSYAAHVRQNGGLVEGGLREEVEHALPQICDILLQGTGHNFRHYKTSTLVRRVMRRIAVLKLGSASEYLERLRSYPAEADLLFRELLINVTAFFRDPEAFETLAREVLSQLFAGRAQGDTIRIWAPGCSTGEEAYTLAILLREQMEALDHPPEVQVFATDIDPHALAFARLGVYPLGIADELSPERLKRFFVRDGQSWRVTKQLRELVLFSAHNLINDPPFSKLDVISCRNVLIYLGSHLQKKLVPVFHFALRPGGYLFLGPSENLNSHRELFRPVNPKHRISQRLPTAIRAPEPLAARSGPAAAVRPPNVPSASETDTYLVMQRITLDEFAPKSVVVNDHGQMVCASGNLEKYVTVGSGAFHNNITHLVRDGLKVGLRTAMKEASEHRRRAIQDGLMLRTEQGVQRVMITVQPMPQLGEDAGLFYIAFQDMGRLLPPGDVSDLPSTEESASFIEQLEHELATTREDLEKTVQELESANEELKSSNEELLSMNEELQSSNEELESSKEEVQSANDLLSRVNTDLENLLASTRVGTVFLDRTGNIRRVTPAARAVYNLRSGDVGRPLSEITHNARLMPPLPTFEEVRSEGRKSEDEVEMRDGTWFLRRVLPYRTSDGAAEGIVLTFTDVTDLKQAETTIRETVARLEASERVYRAIGESIDFGVWVCDPQGANTYLSESFLKLVGLTQEECSGSGWTRLLHPDDAERTVASWMACVRTGGTWDIEHRFKGVDGEWHPVLARGVPVRDDQGTIVCWAGINLDIARQKASEHALEESLASLRTRERELQTIADNTPDALTRFDRDQRHVFVNAAGERTSGRASADIIGRTHGELGVPPEQCDAWGASLQRVFETGLPESIEFTAETQEGPRYYRARLVPELEPGASPSHVLAVSQDITLTRMAEEALRDADRRKDEFLAILAHELRNPLAPVRTGLKLLDIARSPEEAIKIRRMMERQLTHMVRLVDDLLDVSRIARGIVELQRQRVELRSIVELALEASRPLIEGAGHVLAVTLPTEPVWLDADLTRLAQVLTNLLTNAAKFTPHGGRLSLDVTLEKDDVVIRVTDDGMGVSEQMLPRIFEMFSQIHRSVDRAHGGLGIGLGLARRLVEMHGGTVTASSPGLGAGSTFTVRVPAAPRRKEARRVEERPPMEAPPETTDRRLRILVVDDNTDGAETMSELFGLLGHDTAVAHDGPEAIAAVSRFRPDVVFLDIGLPGMSGYEVARHLRADPLLQQPLLIAVTGWGAEKDKQDAQNAGFDFHFVKPVDIERLRAILEKVEERPTSEA